MNLPMPERENPFQPQLGHPDVVRHQAVHCPACGYTPDAAGTLDGSPIAQRLPVDGDWSICFRCGEVSVYAVGPLGVALREATGAELREFADDPANTEHVRRLHQFWAEQR